LPDFGMWAELPSMSSWNVHLNALNFKIHFQNLNQWTKSNRNFPNFLAYTKLQVIVLNQNQYLPH
jgi:hypothetical protein